MSVSGGLSRVVIKFLFFISIALLFILSSGILDVFKSGGARGEGLDNFVSYDGPLNYVNKFWLLVAFICIGLKFTKRATFETFGIGRETLMLLMLLMVSWLWAPDKLAAFKVVVLLVVTIFLIYFHAGVFSPVKQLNMLRGFVFIVLVLSLVAATLFPLYGVSVGYHDGSWQGIFAHKNNLGNFAALAFCLFLGGCNSRVGYFGFVGVVISALLVFMSQSKISIAVVLVVGFLFCAAINFRVRRFMISNQLLIFNVFMALGVVVVFLPFISYDGHALGVTFTGRSFIWSYTLEKIGERPIFGYGLGQFSSYFLQRSQEVLIAVGFNAFSPHNGFVEVLFSLGVVGLLFSYKLLVSIFTVVNKVRGDLTVFYFMIAFVMLNVFESRFLSFNFAFVFFLYLLYIERSRLVFRSG